MNRTRILAAKAQDLIKIQAKVIHILIFNIIFNRLSKKNSLKISVERLIRFSQLNI